MVMSYFEKFWNEKPLYHDAERNFYQNITRVSQKEVLFTPLADEVAKVRQRLLQVKDTFYEDQINTNSNASKNDEFEMMKKKISHFSDILNNIQQSVNDLSNRLIILEKQCGDTNKSVGTNTVNLQKIQQSKSVEDDNDEIDLFASESEEENDEAAKIREERLAAYAEKKSKKPTIIAKSNVILDVKPWSDETDMKQMESEIRKISTDGLLLGAAKLVPLAFGIHKLQISCVIEDDKVSVDWLQEQIEAIEEYVQSVDIAAFNKI